MKKIRSISLSSEIDEMLEQDSKKRGLNVSANLTRILYDYLINNPIHQGDKLPIIQK
tara:strand:+ start:1222 stop:1392 length:171 start_codon:yes stop_codon:yes gene_type:complete